jgi:hypothetical protein
MTHPHAVADGAEDDGGEGLELDAGVGVGGEEVAVVLEVVRMNKANEVDEPECNAESCRWNREPEKAADTVAGASSHHVENRRQKADGRCLGENHGGDEEGQRECERECAEGIACARRAEQFEAEGFQPRGDEERECGERDNQRLEDRHALEDVDVWAKAEEEDAERAGEGRGVWMEFASGALQQNIERDKREAEDTKRESARGYGRDAGELEDDKLKCGPDRKRDGGVEIA